MNRSFLIYKNTSSAQQNKDVLLVFNKQQDCYTFPNYRSKNQNDEDFARIYTAILTGLECTLTKTDTFHNADNSQNTYYEFELDLNKSNLPKNKEFMINNNKYRWFASDEVLGYDE